MSVFFISILTTVLSSLYTPEQVHIAWTDNEQSMSVTWGADESSVGSMVQWTPIQSHNQTVKSYAYSALGTWVVFPNMQVSKILQRHIHVCKAYMTNLVQGALYAYRVGSDIYGWTDQFSFQAKKTYQDSPMTRLLVYGDLGIGDQIIETMQRLIEETNTYEYDAIIHNGDIAYDLDTNQGKYGDIFLRSVEPIASRLPYMVSQGNHESGPVLPHYINRFQMPGNVSNFWYSFNTGMAHIIAFNTEPIFDGLNDLQAQQMAFLQNDLKSYDKQKYPWLIVYGHRPMYCSPNLTTTALLKEIPRYRWNPDCQENADLVRSVFEDLFYNAGADMVITGHVHAYERLSSVYQNVSVPCQYQDQNTCIGSKAPVYIVTGVPGQDDCYSPISPTPLPFSMAQDDNLGYSRLTVFNSTHLLFEQVRSATKEVSDFLWLIK